MTLDKQRWRQVETLYHAALEREPGAREAFLAQACAGDEELRREVEELLRYDGAAESFIQGNALAFEARRLDPEELSQTGPQLLPGQSVGAYKILALLGRGGMVVVYRARDERLRRDVASSWSREMKIPTKFVKPLTPEQRGQLQEIMKSQAPQRKRMRAHAILLSERRYSIDQIADIYQVDRDRVSLWFDWWEEFKFDGLDDDPRSGRPPKLNEEEQRRAVEIVRKEPRSTMQGLKRIANEIGKVISGDTLKNILKAADFTWKRMRRGLRFFRDEDEFRAAQAELAQLRVDSLLPTSEFDLWYFDEAGFTLQPCVPYAWQLVGERLELASTHGPRQNVLAFFNLRHQFHSFAFEGSIDTHTVIHCFDLFNQRRKRPALVAIDNAPVHTSDEFEEEIERWEEEGLYVKFLPPYCPELNLIEILWHKIKYEWLPLDAYQGFKKMTGALFEVIRGIGSKYRITFA